jgi:polyribonucleotide nucleotidyltransferase
MDRSLFVERALTAVLPPEKEFPFTMRLNVEAFAADGGSACAAVSGGAAALADAGVPLREMVAGISVGLLSVGGAWNREAYTISEPSDACSEESFGRYELVLDPSAVEVAFGGMELRVAGTAKGITAMQLDARVPGGVPEEVLIEALAAAQVGRLRVLSTMKTATLLERGESAPMFDVVRVPADAVGQVIGREGAAIRAVEAASGAKVHVGNGGELNVFAPSAAQFRVAKEALLASAGAHLEPGELYRVKVAAVKDFGAFVTLPGSEARALLHISEVALERIRAVEDVLKPGDEVEVAFLGRDARGAFRVSRKAALLKASKK